MEKIHAPFMGMFELDQPDIVINDPVLFKQSSFVIGKCKSCELAMVVLTETFRKSFFLGLYQKKKVLRA